MPALALSRVGSLPRASGAHQAVDCSVYTLTFADHAIAPTVRISCSLKIENGPFASSPARRQDRMERESIKIRFNKILVAK